MRGKHTSALFSMAALLMLVGAANGGTITSTFDTDREDWTVADLIQPFNGPPSVAADYTPTYTDTGGNPGGAIYQEDMPGGGNAWFFRAPSKLLGDRSASLFGTLAWDLKLDRQSGDGTWEQVILHDGTNALYYLDTGPGPANTWRHYSVALVGTSFHFGSSVGPLATDLQLKEVLTNLRALYILGDWVDGNEVGYLDNVIMTGGCPPASIRLSEVEICWLSASNVIYQVDFRSDLTTNTWVPLFTNILGSGQEMCVYDKIVPGAPQRFYTVICPGQ